MKHGRARAGKNARRYRIDFVRKLHEIFDRRIIVFRISAVKMRRNFGVSGVCRTHVHAICVVPRSAEDALSARAGNIHDHAVSDPDSGSFGVLLGDRRHPADKFMTDYFGRLHWNFTVVNMQIRPANSAGN